LVGGHLDDIVEEGALELVRLTKEPHDSALVARIHGRRMAVETGIGRFVEIGHLPVTQ